MAGTFELQDPGMDDFEFELIQDLEGIRQQGLFRELRRVDSPQRARIQCQDRTFLNFSSNDYLGLANDPLLKEAAIKAVEQFGAGAGASRLVCGSLKPHHELEDAIAAFKASEAALSFSSGYAAALGTITALVGSDDIIAIDKRVHASIVDAARLSGAKLRVFPHNDLNALAKILKWADQRTSKPAASRAVAKRRQRVLIVTESIFSMDGDRAPLSELVALKDQFGAWLMVDEAHATGILGKHGRGLADALGVSDRIEIQMGTLGKALGSAGGFICGRKALIELLVNRARSFIFSTAPVPAAAAAASAGIQVAQSREGDARREMLGQRVRQLRQGLIPLGTQMIGAGNLFTRACAALEFSPGPILPLMVGDETTARKLADSFRERGMFTPAIRYPSVARGAARLRLTVTAAHSPEDIEQFLRVTMQLTKFP